jgi:predicted flap endonuclease-1-like 5' DNA nuclease
MAKSIQDVEGIGPKYAEQLKQEGINTAEKLLDTACTKKGRKALAEKTGISESMILKWVNMCDLFRINGVGGQFAELLEGAGVDTVKELRNRNAENLAAKMAEVNAAKKLCKVSPSQSMVEKWVEEAKTLDPKVSH